MQDKPMTVIANLHQVEGWHYATSQQLTGLLVAHKDLEVVKAEIPVLIKELYRAEFNQEVVLEKLYLPHTEDKAAYSAILIAA